MIGTMMLAVALAMGGDGESTTYGDGVGPRPVPHAPDSLPRSTPEAEGISSRAILEFVTAVDTGVDAMHSFMLVRHGKVVAEGWWGPYDARTPHMLYSLSKSFTSTAVGLAIAEGRLSLDDPVLKFFPDEAPAQPSRNLREMRVRDLLRMNTGHQSEPTLFAWMGPDTLATDVSWVRRFLAHPVPFKPGTHFLYNTPATYMLSAIVQKTTGQSVRDYLVPRLYEPLGIATPAWGTSPQGVTLGGYGMFARTEDIAKFGQLYLQKGMWNGRQVVPAAWVEEATGFRTSNGSNPESDWDQGYGYQFWRSRHGFRGDGAFGQYCLVLPEQDAVLVITSGVRDMQRTMNVAWRTLLPAMQAAPLAADAAATRALRDRLAGLAMRTVAGRATTPLAGKVAGRWYAFPENERGIRAVRLDVAGRAPALVVRTAGGETRTPVGIGAWTRSGAGFANGIDRMLSAPAHPVVATNGAWTSDSTFTLKLAGTETPFVSTMVLRFDGDRLVLDGEHNVAFGPTRLPQLVGRVSDGKVSSR